MVGLKPKTSKTANLMQAIEWVAFGLEPLIPKYDISHREPKRKSYDQNKLIDAKADVFKCLSEGIFKAKGIKKEVKMLSCSNCNYQYIPKFTIYDPEKKKLLKVFCIPREHWRFNQVLWEYSVLINLTVTYPHLSEEDIEQLKKEHNYIELGKWKNEAWYAYECIRIKTNDLLKVFPKQTQEAIEPEPENLKDDMLELEKESVNKKRIRYCLKVKEEISKGTVARFVLID